MKSALPMTFIDIALGKPSPRVYMVENNEDAISNYDFNTPTETTSNSNQNANIIGYPVYPSKEITQTTPFIYQLGYTGRMGLDKLNQPYEIITTTPHTKQSFTDYMNKVRETLCHDLIQNGIPEHNFNPEINLQFARRLYTFNVEDLKIFMDERGMKKAHILGFSDGGNIAMIFALRYPERVDRLILNGANLEPGGVKRSVQIPVEIGYRVARFFSMISKKAEKNAEILGLMVNDPNISVLQLSNIRAETLVIAGTKDMIREEHTRLIAGNIPGAELAIIPGDHFVAAGNPAAFNERVLQFLLFQR